MSEIEWKGYESNPTNNFAAKWYLNGFPKSGLHLAVQFIKRLTKKMPLGQLHPRPWVGTFKHNSWSEEWQDIQMQLYNLSRCMPGHYFKGHCAYKPEIEHFMWYLGLAHVFIYRDLRDVAVSQAYHILSDNEDLKHPAKDRYRELGEFDEVLEAVIVGLDEFPGIVHRWEAYAPWLEVDWVYKFQFERVLSDPKETAGELVMYGLQRISDIYKLNLKPAPESVAAMVDAMTESAVDRKEEALTFRKGKPGEWRTEFTQRHIELFKETDQAGWIDKLGYRW